MDILVKVNDYFSELYPFDFTTNGRNGRYGRILKFSVPRTARYLIKAWGASGGTHYTTNSVEVKGGQSTNRTAAELGLSIEDNAGTGGGGGSFVYTSANALLLAAGGGGGASAGYEGVDGQKGSTGTSSVGKRSYQVRRGGVGGNPGGCNSDDASYHGGVGAGWLSQGCARAGTSHGERGGSGAQGWVGGLAGGMNSGSN